MVGNRVDSKQVDASRSLRPRADRMLPRRGRAFSRSPQAMIAVYGVKDARDEAYASCIRVANGRSITIHAPPSLGSEVAPQYGCLTAECRRPSVGRENGLITAYSNHCEEAFRSGNNFDAKAAWLTTRHDMFPARILFKSYTLIAHWIVDRCKLGTSEAGERHSS